MKSGHLLIGGLAGVVSALLLATMASGSGLSMLLVALSPLPLVIVGLGWSWVAALVGALIASAVFAAVVAPVLGLVYLIGVGGPAVGLTYLALLGRPATESEDPEVQRAGGTEWYPIGRMVFWLAIAAGVIGTLWALQFGFSIAAYLEATRPATVASLNALSRIMQVPPPGPAYEQLVRTMSLVVPVATAATSFVVLVLNLWLGGKVVARSGRSPRPWPDLGRLELPRMALYSAIAALILSLALPDFPGLIAGLFAATLTLAYMFQGLAVIHYVTREMTARGLLLASLYLVLMVFSGSIVLIAMLGLLEPTLKLRARADARRAPPSGPRPPAGF